METNAIVIVTKKLVNRSVLFENELVPLSGRINYMLSVCVVVQSADL